MPASMPRGASSNFSPRRSATRTPAWPITGPRAHFFAWVERHEIGGLADIEPIHVAAYIEVLQTTAAKPTVKLHLAAIRMLFDWLVVGQVLAVNPAHAVRGPKHVVRRGKTPVLTEEQARAPKLRKEEVRRTESKRLGRGPARSRADRRHDLRLRPHRRRRRA